MSDYSRLAYTIDILKRHGTAGFPEINACETALTQLEAKDKIIAELVEALTMYKDNAEEAGNLFEDSRNEEAWEWLLTAQLAAKAALSKAKEQE